MLPFIFPIDRVSEESKRASVGPVPCMASDAPSTSEGLTLHKSQMLKRWVEPWLSSFQYDDDGDDDDGRCKDQKERWHGTQTMDTCFPHKASRKMRKVLSNQPNFAAQKCTLSPFPAGTMQERSGCLIFPMAGSCAWSCISTWHIKSLSWHQQILILIHKYMCMHGCLNLL